MTRSEAITALYALFNAPHNADINLVGLNVLLDELYKSHPQEEPWPEETEGHIAGGVHPPQRTERPVDCERCNRLEEQAYDLVGKLRVANIKLSMLLPRTWAGLMRGVRVEGDTVVIKVKNGNDAARKLCGALIEEMNK